MSVYQVTNRKSSPALQGQGVLVTLNDADSGQLGNWAKGNLVAADTSGKTGTIASVDTKGHSFLVTPIQMDRTFDSGVYGYLASGQVLTITY